jgi:HSP20 family protein
MESALEQQGLSILDKEDGTMAGFNRWEDLDVEHELVELQRELNRRAGRSARSGGPATTRVFPSIIISASGDKLLVRAEVPGMNLQDFDISISGDMLTVEGARLTGEGLEGGWYHRRERESGGFSRAIRLPAAVDGDRAEATYVAGVLTISLPLQEAAKPKEVAVRVEEA